MMLDGFTGAFLPTDISKQKFDTLFHSLKLSHESPSGPDDQSIVRTPSTITVCNSVVPFQSKNTVSIILGKPTWHNPILEAISKQSGHSAALASAYEKDSSNFFNTLGGHFAFAIHDLNSGKTILAVDRIGVYSLAYYFDYKSGFFFSTNINTLARLAIVPTELSHQNLFNYIYFHMIPSPGSIYEGVEKLGPAEFVEYNQKRVSKNAYWEPTFSESNSRSKKSLGEDLHSIIQSSVKNSLPNNDRYGAFLSGGLDSSTVAGKLSRIDSSTTRTFSIGFNEPGYDEMAFARIAADHFHTTPFELYVTPDDVISAVPKISQSFFEPFGNSSALPVYFCAKLAKEHGVDTLLAGDGGDEIFAGNERYTKQLLFQSYSKVPGILRNSLLEPIIQVVGKNTRNWLANKLVSFVDQANVQLPDRLQTYNFLHRHSAEEIFDSDFLRTIDIEQPIWWIRRRYNQLESISDLNRMLYLDWKFTLADNDLRKVVEMCHLADVDVVFPLLSDELLDFSCQIPSDLKIRGNKLRYFFKRAMKDYLPKEILSKTKHGFGLPFGYWMEKQDALRELSYDSVLQLKKHSYFKSSFLDNAIRLHREGHTGYYGELIWILMIFSLWLEHNQSTFNKVK